MSLCALERKLECRTGILAAILKIQDGCHQKWISVNIIGFLIPVNMGVDTKIMTLCGLEMAKPDPWRPF